MANFTGNQKTYEHNQPTFGNKYVIDIHYEPLHDKIHTDRVYIWNQYESSIRRIVASYTVRYKLSFDDLFGDSWIYFNKGLDKYNPHYNGNFYPLKNYLLGYIFNNFRGNIAYNRIKLKREMPMIANDDTISDSNHLIDNGTAIEDVYFDSELEKLINSLPEQYSKIVKLSIAGVKQQDISKIINVSQSRISFVLSYMRKIIKNKDEKFRIDKHSKTRDTIIELWRYCHDYNLD